MRDAKPDAARLGQAITRAREHAGLSLFDLGIAVGLAETEVAAYEAGRRSISVARLRAIALACGTSSAKLLENSHPLPVELDTAQWRELGALFARLSQASRDTLVSFARRLVERERGR